MPSITYTGQLSASDLAHVRSSQSNFSGYVIFVVIMGMMLASTLYLAIHDHLVSYPIFLQLWIEGVLVLGIIKGIWKRRRPAPPSSIFARMPFDGCINDSGIIFGNSLGNLFHSWLAFDGFVEDQHAFFLQHNKQNMLIVFKRFLTSDQEKQARQLMHVKIRRSGEPLPVQPIEPPPLPYNAQ